jgi:hypothetical protein
MGQAARKKRADQAKAKRKAAQPATQEPAERGTYHQTHKLTKPALNAELAPQPPESAKNKTAKPTKKGATSAAADEPAPIVTHQSKSTLAFGGEPKRF